MTYDLYDLILDLTEAGFTVQFRPYFVDDKPYRPEYLSVTIRNNKVVSGGNGCLNPLKVRELGEDELVRHMIQLQKYAIMRMSEEDDEQSTAQGTGPTE